MSEDEEGSDQDDRVGYCRPPRAHQFKKGRSGNPRGRPKTKGKRQLEPSEASLKLMYREEIMRLVDVRVNGENERMSAARAVIRSILVLAMKGNVAAIRQVILLMNHAALTPEESQTISKAELEKLDQVEYGKWVQRFLSGAPLPE